VAKAAQLLAGQSAGDPESFCSTIAVAIAEFCPELAIWIERLPALVREPVLVAVPCIAWAGMPTPEFDRPIITPFVIPTVLASFWCLLRYTDSWSSAVTTAIRLGGDVDTLGAIVGALAGVRHGVAGIPENFRREVRQAAQLEELARRYFELANRLGW
jgi:hypothetical protein